MTIVFYVLAAILAVFLAYTIVVPSAMWLPKFSHRFHLFCPTHRTYGDIHLNAMSAAVTAAYGAPRISVERCTLRARGDRCPENCLEELHV
ncbi:MAG: hypothetical protein HY342_09505 [Candidatus Lambdaproteobacteria bacterium]|nr:hypothetical protein [Candidatus Lambdaproteobacteria bacterium]